MKDVFGKISDKIKRPKKNEEWSGQIRQLKQGFDAINTDVQNALKNKPSEDLLPVYETAATEIPAILSELNALLPKGKHNKSLWLVFQEALKTYLLACEHFQKSLLENDEREYVQGIRDMKDAEMLLKQAKNLFK